MAETFNPWLTIQGGRRKISDANWQKPLAWNRAADAAPEEYHRPRVSPSRCDPFEDWQDSLIGADGRVLGRCPRCDHREPQGAHCTKCGANQVDLALADIRRDFFALIDATPNLDYVLRTRFPENIRRMWPMRQPAPDEYKDGRQVWDRPNVHLLYSASDQETLEAGLPHLLKCRDLVPVLGLGLSLEPLVGPVDLALAVGLAGIDDLGSVLDWVSVGGESDPGARPCNVEWIWDVALQCRAAGVPHRITQLGAYIRSTNANAMEWPDDVQFIHDGGHCAAECRVRLRDPSGADPSEWPEDLRKEYPEVTP